MCKFIGKSNERILCKLSKNEILWMYSIVLVAMETLKTSNFSCQSKSFISMFFTCQVSAFELQPSLAMIWQMTHSQTAKTVFSHLKWNYQYCYAVSPRHVAFPITLIESHCIYYLEDLWIKDLCVCLSVTRIQQVWNLTGAFFSLKVCERWFCLALVTMRVSTHY